MTWKDFHRKPHYFCHVSNVYLFNWVTPGIIGIVTRNFETTIIFFPQRNRTKNVIEDQNDIKQNFVSKPVGLRNTCCKIHKV